MASGPLLPHPLSVRRSEVGKASVICVVYAADNAQTYERVSSYWLPFIRKHSESQEVPSKTPVILVRNKSDLCEPSEADPNKETDESENALLNECWSVMQEFKEIVTCVDCSARAVKHIPDVFHYALNSVLFPMSPLYDLDKHELKPKVLVALERVFAICDRDKDGAPHHPRRRPAALTALRALRRSTRPGLIHLVVLCRIITILPAVCRLAGRQRGERVPDVLLPRVGAAGG